LIVTVTSAELFFPPPSVATTVITKVPMFPIVISTTISASLFPILLTLSGVLLLDVTVEKVTKELRSALLSLALTVPAIRL